MIISISGRAGSGKDTAGKLTQWLMYNSSVITLEQWLKHEDRNEYRAVASGWQIKKWADPLRKIAAILLGMDIKFLYTDEFKQMMLPECWNKIRCNYRYDGRGYHKYFTSTEQGDKYLREEGCYGEEYVIQPMTGREFLQKLGTDAIRNQLHEQSWVNALMAEYKPLNDVLLMQGKREHLRNAPSHTTDLPNWIITDTRFPNELSAVKKAGGVTLRIERPDFEWVSIGEERVKLPIHESETSLDTADFDFVVENNGTIEDLAQKLLPIISNLNSNGYNSTEGS